MQQTDLGVKKGVNQWSFDESMSLKEIFEFSKQSGYDGVEMTLAATGSLSMSTSDKELAQIRDLATECGIVINSVATGLFWQFSLTSNRADIRQKALDVVKREVEVAQALGADCVLVCPGTVGVDFAPDEVVPDAHLIEFFAGSEVISYEVAYERSQEALLKASLWAKECQVAIGVENIWNKFLLSPLEFKTFVDQINSEWVGVYLDVANMLAYGYPEQWLRILKERIKRIHLKDYRRKVGTLEGFVPLLAGDVNWPEVAAAVKEIGYSGWVNAEIVPQYAFHPLELVKSTSLAIDAIFG
ncbi:MAG: sugar phosphate isomerase/epimerase family protein [Sphaerochaetaceae bacterium]|jgi:L-ribulose-5-phosphate 3-epimerase